MASCTDEIEFSADNGQLVKLTYAQSANSLAYEGHPDFGGNDLNPALR